jgi:prevent-host-death family protein
MKTMTSRDFNQDTSGAKKQAAFGPVVITDRGKPAHVLMTFAEYQKLKPDGMSLLEALDGGQGHDFDFEAP